MRVTWGLRAILAIAKWLAIFVGVGLLVPERTGCRLFGQPRDRGEAFQRTELSQTVYLDEIDGTTRSQLQRLDEFLVTDQWRDAALLLSRLLEDNLDNSHKVMAISPPNRPFGRYIPWGRYLFHRASSLPAPAFAAWMDVRRSTDKLAEDWYVTGVETLDERLLRRVVDQAYTSTVADNALLALGELALHRGHPNAARRYWEESHAMFRWQLRDRRLPLWLAAEGQSVEAVWEPLSRQLGGAARTMDAYPSSEISPARVLSNLVLAAILDGDRPRANWELEVLRRYAPDATGILAGQSTNLVAGLAAFLETSKDWPTRVGHPECVTFAGNSSRNGVIVDEIDLGGIPEWTYPLNDHYASDRPWTSDNRWMGQNYGQVRHLALRTHPLIVDNMVLWADDHSIRCLDLRTGKPFWNFDAEGIVFSLPDTDNFAVVDDGERIPHAAAAGSSSGWVGRLRPTLTVHGSLLVACLGDGRTTPRQLLGLNLNAQGALQFGPVSPESAAWTFQGSPVTDGQYCWVGMRQHEVTSREYIACYDVRTGEMLWRTQICAAETISQDEGLESPNQLLTLHEDTIYYCTNLGAIGAVDANRGHVRWITLYPREGATRHSLLDEPDHLRRELVPCIVHHGRVLAAPSDSRYLFALDANSGERIWHSDVYADVVQLLGATDTYLIANGQRLWWIDLATGRPADIPANPFPSDPRSVPYSLGRGLLSGKHVYWPARGEDSELHVFDIHTGLPTSSPRNLSRLSAESGNLIYGNGFLLIAASDTLYAFRNRFPKATVAEATAVRTIHQCNSPEGLVSFPRTLHFSAIGKPNSPHESTRRMSQDDLQAIAQLREASQRVIHEISKVIVGQQQVIEELLIALFAGGHCLLVGVPGLAKTLIIRSLASALSLDFRRIQFTPDLMPSDITGTEVIQEDKLTGTRTLRFIPGPIFANVILADEINRTPPKTQAALLESMQEHQVTVGGQKHQIPEPFFVLATQNPVEQEGTYPLPEAQLDRFMLNIVIDYPDADDELQIVKRSTSDVHVDIEPTLSAADIARMCHLVRRVPIADHIAMYALQLARQTRPQRVEAPDFINQFVIWGAGPRASQFLVLAAKARAILYGREFVSHDDVRAIAKPVLRHRIRTNFNADADGITTDDLIDRLIGSTNEDASKGAPGAKSSRSTNAR